MGKAKRKLALLLSFVLIFSLMCPVIADNNTIADSAESLLGEKSETDEPRSDILKVAIPYDVSFSINLIEGTTMGWVSSRKFEIVNAGAEDVIVKFNSVYCKFKDEENFVMVDNAEEVKKITDKKAYFMQIDCEGNVNKEHYVVTDSENDDEEDDITFFLEGANGEDAKNKGTFEFSGAANPLSEIRWADKDVSVYIKFGIYNAKTKELLSESKILTSTADEKKDVITSSAALGTIKESEESTEAAAAQELITDIYDETLASGAGIDGIVSEDAFKTVRNEEENSAKTDNIVLSDENAVSEPDGGDGIRSGEISGETNGLGSSGGGASSVTSSSAITTDMTSETTTETTTEKQKTSGGGASSSGKSENNVPDNTVSAHALEVVTSDQALEVDEDTAPEQDLEVTEDVTSNEAIETPITDVVEEEASEDIEESTLKEVISESETDEKFLEKEDSDINVEEILSDEEVIENDETPEEALNDDTSEETLNENDEETLDENDETTEEELSDDTLEEALSDETSNDGTFDDCSLDDGTSDDFSNDSDDFSSDDDTDCSSDEE